MYNAYKVSFPRFGGNFSLYIMASLKASKQSALAYNQPCTSYITDTILGFIEKQSLHEILGHLCHHRIQGTLEDSRCFEKSI
jgi:hypothetical protein